MRTFWILPCLLLWASLAHATPDQIHVNVTDDPSSSVTIQWHTVSDEPSSVRYGEDPLNLAAFASGSSKAPPHSVTGRIHQVSLSGLQPDTLYFFECGSLSGGWSAISQFRTAPVGRAPFTLALYGETDSGSRFDTLMGHLRQETPDWHVHLGGMAFAGGLADQWNGFFNSWQPLAARRTGAAVCGEPEYERLFGQDIANTSFLGRMALPRDEQTYSLRWGNVHCAFYNTEEPLTAGSPQYVWLANNLTSAAASPKVDWIFTFGYRPIYSSGSAHGSQSAVRDLRTLFDQVGVDVSFSSQERNYERSFPLLNNFPTQTTDVDRYEAPAGTVYVVTGGGGAGLDSNFNVQPAWSAYREAAYHYTKVIMNAAGNEVTIEAIEPVLGNLLDSFTIVAPTPTPTPIPLPPTITPTPGPSSTPGPTATPKPFTLTPTAIPSPTPVIPKVLLGGYGTTDLDGAAGGALTLLAVVPPGVDPDVSLAFAGAPLGLRLFDDGFHGDFGPGDSVYGIEWPIDPGTPGLGALLELQVAGGSTWPYLTVAPPGTATPTPFPTATQRPVFSEIRFCRRFTDFDPASDCDDVAGVLCSNEVTCDDDTVSAVIDINRGEDGDAYEIAWLRNGSPEFIETNTVTGDCPQKSLVSTLVVDDRIRGQCGDSWSVRLSINGQALAERAFFLTTLLPNCECP